MVKAFTYAQRALITNGMISEYSPLSRGIKQGDTMPALLIIIQAKLLSRMTRNNEDIETIKTSSRVTEKEVKLCQWMDDTNISLWNCMYIAPCLKVIKAFDKF